jgi:uncharacterized membrane protein YkoI
VRRTLARPASAAVLALTLGLGLSACGGDDDAVSAEDRDQATQAAIAAVGGEATVTGVDAGDGDDQYAFEVEVQFAGGEDADVQLDENFDVIGTPPSAPSAAAPSDDASSSPAPSDSATPTPAAGGSGDDGFDDGGFDDSDLDDDGDNLTGQTLQRAVDAALAETGGGRVTDAERADADEDHAFEVEVQLDAATDDDVSVELDERFGVVRVDR